MLIRELEYKCIVPAWIASAFLDVRRVELPTVGEPAE